jgi:N,N'-diacetyllegionaminate synthase
MVIAEVAQAHDGSLGMAHAFIDALKETGVDVVKFQTHIAEAESSAFEPFRIQFSYQDANRYDYWKRIGFTSEQWQGLKQHCEEAGMEFMSSPFSIAAVNLLEQIGVKRYKIGSGEVTNSLLLRRIAQTHKPVMLSSGMSSWQELDDAVALLKTSSNEVAVFQCTTAYPTTPEQWGLGLIKKIKERFHLPVGFSDHSGEVFAPLAATALGAEIIEFHVAFHREQFGPDTKASIPITNVRKLVEGIRQIRSSLSHDLEKEVDSENLRLKTIFGKSLATNKHLQPGHVLDFEDLEAKKPGDRGIPASEYKNVIGKTINKELYQYDFLQYQHFE